MAIYLDDILIMGKTDLEHLSNLAAVLQRLQEADVKLKPGQCSFMLQKVKYLGHNFWERFQLTSEKVQGIDAMWMHHNLRSDTT